MTETQSFRRPSLNTEARQFRETLLGSKASFRGFSEFSQDKQFKETAAQLAKGMDVMLVDPSGQNFTSWVLTYVQGGNRVVLNRKASSSSSETASAVGVTLDLQGLLDVAYFSSGKAISSIMSHLKPNLLPRTVVTIFEKPAEFQGLRGMRSVISQQFENQQDIRLDLVFQTPDAATTVGKFFETATAEMSILKAQQSRVKLFVHTGMESARQAGIRMAREQSMQQEADPAARQKELERIDSTRSATLAEHGFADKRDQRFLNLLTLSEEGLQFSEHRALGGSVTRVLYYSPEDGQLTVSKAPGGFSFVCGLGDRGSDALNYHISKLVSVNKVSSNGCVPSDFMHKQLPRKLWTRTLSMSFQDGKHLLATFQTASDMEDVARLLNTLRWQQEDETLRSQKRYYPQHVQKTKGESVSEVAPRD